MRGRYLFLSLILVLFLGVAVYADSDNVIIVDNACLFSDVSEMYNQLEEISNRNNVGILVYTGYEGSNTEYSAEDIQKDYFPNQSSIIFLINMDERMIWLRAEGDCKGMLSDQKAYNITDRVYKYASSGDYTKCCMEAFKHVDDALNGSITFSFMQVFINLLLSLNIGVVITYMWIVISRKGDSVDLNSLLKHSRHKFEVRLVSDRITSSCIRRSSSSGHHHHSSGHHGGGSRHHGGGGGHRF